MTTVFDATELLAISCDPTYSLRSFADQDGLNDLVVLIPYEKVKILRQVPDKVMEDAIKYVNRCFDKRSGGYRFSDSESYDGRTCFTTGRLTVDKYSVNASFEGRGAFKDSSDSTSFSVTRKRHH